MDVPSETREQYTAVYDKKRRDRVLGVCLEEYKTLSGEIEDRVRFQQQLMNYQILALGVVATITVALMQGLATKTISDLVVRVFLLVSPLVFFCFSLSFSNHDAMIVSKARYIYKILKPKMELLLSGTEVLQFEEFLAKERDFKLKNIGKLTYLAEEYLLPLGPPLFLLALYFFSFPLQDLLVIDWSVWWQVPWNHPLLLGQLVILALELVFLVLVIRVKHNAGRNYSRILE